MTKRINKLEWFFTQGGWIAGLLAMGIMVAIGREVIGRYLFHSPTDWVLELSGYLLVGIVYVGAAWVAQVDGHIRVDIVYSHFRGKTKSVMDIIIYLIAIFYCSILIWQGWLLAGGSLTTGMRSSQSMMWPLFPSQILVPMGALFTTVVFVIKLYRHCRELTSSKFSKGGEQ